MSRGCNLSRYRHATRCEGHFSLNDFNAKFEGIIKVCTISFERPEASP